ncbi:hypothetical protein COO60DRAFT_1293449 [Scenedesmus sp. NREL 46B-D3]|nr:hypothetical protein COO60DRAFT_1293449 [Scenedesmus sp. NREL 46B-D3]
MMLLERVSQPFGTCLASNRKMATVVRCSSSSNSSSSVKSSSAAVDRRAVLAQLAASAGCLVGLQGAITNTAAAEDLTVAQAAAGGFIDWWKSRRTVNGGFKLLAPLYAAQQRLQQASDVLGAEAVGSSELLAALQLVRASSLNCYMFEALPDDTIETKASLFTQKLSYPCTFRIVLKNATDLEPAAVQDAAREKMELLVLAYQKLDDYLEMAREGSDDAVPKAREQLKATQLIAADIEAFVKQTLGV